MAPVSAGLLMWRRNQETGAVQVFLIHPGGPFFQHKDQGAWGIPKGMTEKGEDCLEAAIREFREEVGLVSHGPYVCLGQVKQKSGKIVHAWAFEVEPGFEVTVSSTTFSMEWPRGSGRYITVPEADRGDFFDIRDAKTKINQAQSQFIDRLMEHLGAAVRSV